MTTAGFMVIALTFPVPIRCDSQRALLQREPPKSEANPMSVRQTAEVAFLFP